MTNYCSIGKVVATFGLKGEVIIRHQLGKKTALKGLATLFIEALKDEMLPYFIQSAKVKSPEEIYVKLEGIESKEAAQRIVQKQVWLTEEDFHKYTAKQAPISLLGFHIIDQGVDLGEILEVIEQPHQLLCRIEHKNREALIPVHDGSLEKIDQKKRQVLVTLPEGLLDIY
ncbi:MAG TPA: ribosome maturation factor RimM [Flavitalea sp.]|nr:ribosome maturation factor RimM [Flavitalea sp.]